MGHVTSCWLVEEGGDFDVQLFGNDGKKFFGCRVSDRPTALLLAENLRAELTVDSRSH
jgi:hypothetical protein